MGVREWIKQNPKTENIELPEPVKPKAGSEKLNWNDTPKDAVKKDHISDDDELDPPDPDERLPDIDAADVIVQPVTPKRHAKQRSKPRSARRSAAKRAKVTQHPSSKGITKPPLTNNKAPLIKQNSIRA